MSLSLNEKLRQVLDFLVAVRHPRVFQIMSTRGFDKKALDEGWALFTVAAGAKLAYRGRGRRHPVARHLVKLDTWENTWFPVVMATLKRHHPALYENIFLNLHQTDGPEDLISISTLLTRLAEVEPALKKMTVFVIQNPKGDHTIFKPELCLLCRDFHLHQ